MLFVADPAAARAALASGLLTCPDCDGRLAPWGRARLRELLDLTGPAPVIPDRARCRSCRRTHVLLPAEALPRRRSTARLVGTALLAGAALAPAPSGVPERTARGWRAAVRAAGPALARHATAIARVCGDDPGKHGTGVHHTGETLPGLLEALAHGAHWLRTGLPTPVLHHPGPHSGIDYLALLVENLRRATARQLRLADPAMAGRLTPWAAVAVLTAGRLLTTPPGS